MTTAETLDRARLLFIDACMYRDKVARDMFLDFLRDMGEPEGNVDFWDAVIDNVQKGDSNIEQIRRMNLGVEVLTNTVQDALKL